MTLIFASVKKDEVVVTADGLSCSRQWNYAPGRATLQKIFPSPLRPIAIAQCGKNFVDVYCEREGKKVRSLKKNLEEWLCGFFQRSGSNAVYRVALGASESIRRADPAFFDDKEENSHVWVFGYSKDRDLPEFYRVGKNGPPEDLLDVSGPAVEPLILHTGSGARHLPESLWEDHDWAWARAIHRQKEQHAKDFGGHMHRLRLTSAGWSWAEPPMRGTLGLGEWSLREWMPVEDYTHDRSRPRCAILLARDELLGKMTRCLEPGRERARTYTHLRKEFLERHPEFNLLGLTDQLIAVYDDAEVAYPEDVSLDDARLYGALVQHVLQSLPSQTT